MESDSRRPVGSLEMMRRFEDARILMYSHDTFGLGHCGVAVRSLIRWSRASRPQCPDHFWCDHCRCVRLSSARGLVRVPRSSKLRNGEYTSLEKHIDLQDTLKMRQSIIRSTAETFRPDIFIVDKEPLGLRGEVEDTLEAYLKARSGSRPAPRGHGCAASS